MSLISTNQNIVQGIRADKLSLTNLKFIQGLYNLGKREKRKGTFPKVEEMSSKKFSRFCSFLQWGHVEGIQECKKNKYELKLEYKMAKTNGPLAIEKIILLFRSSWNIGNIHFLPLSFSWTSVSHCCPKRIKMWNQKLNYWIIFEVLILDLPVGNFAGKSSLCIWRSIFLKGCQQNVNLYWYSCPILNGEYFNRGIFALHFSV